MRISDWSSDVCSSDLIMAEVRARRPFDERRVLLTGMSDGGTFCWVSGLLADSPFTHLAPFSASFHPMLLAFADPARIRGLPVQIGRASSRETVCQDVTTRVVAVSVKKKRRDIN